jgi:uncharacterized membrane-anchored protein
MLVGFSGLNSNELSGVVMFVRSAFAVSAILFCCVASADVPPPKDKSAPPPADLSQPVTDPTDPNAAATVAPDTGAPAPVPAEAEMKPEEVAANSLVERDGKIALPGGQASVVIADGFAFLDAADTAKLLTQVWGNPPGTGEGVLGAIVPKGANFFAPESWAAIITYDNDGHVADDDAASINYDDLLKEMQGETAAENDERTKAGYETITLVGWAQKPSYDAAGHKLHWAKHLRFGKEDETLNYAIRALGRTGVLQVNVVASMGQLADINTKVPQLLTMVTFNEGHRYADFNSSTDPVAAYGLAALVAGGVAAKTGLLKGLLVLLAASWKFIAIGVAVLGAWLWRFLGRKSGGAET